MCIRDSHRIHTPPAQNSRPVDDSRSRFGRPPLECHNRGQASPCAQRATPADLAGLSPRRPHPTLWKQDPVPGNTGSRVLLPWNAKWISDPVSYTHLRAHETVLDLVCRLLLEKKKKKTN